MFAKLQILARLSEDVDELVRLFSTDPPDQFFFDDQYLTGTGLSSTRAIADAQTDVALAIGDLTSLRAIVLFSDGPITVKVAGGGTALKCGTSAPSVLPGIFILVGAGHTTLLVSNASGAVRKVRYYVAGA